jgi:YesN/AraC family two-component response regulator
MEIKQDTLQGKRILLVDDECLVRETVRSLLCFDNHEVVEANNGAEALRLFSEGKFDLVLTDFRMPFIEGDELAMRIRELAPQQPILMITGYSYKAGRHNPVDSILYKPFDLQKLRGAVSRLLQKSSTPDESAVCAQQ